MTPKSAVNEMSGMTEARLSPLIYVDANSFIYAIEGDEVIANPAREFFAHLREHPGVAVTSELTLAEILPKAAKESRKDNFDLIVWSGIIILQPVSREILIETADYRRMVAIRLPDGRTSMPKLPDSIHIVTAVRSGCKTILSADGKLRLPAGIVSVEPNKANFSMLMKALS